MRSSALPDQVVHLLSLLLLLLLLRYVDAHGVQEIDLMINEIDKNNDGEIDFGEFVAVMSRKVQATYTAEEVKNAFKVSEFASHLNFGRSHRAVSAAPL